jgi:molecular chaperone GrpE
MPERGGPADEAIREPRAEEPAVAEGEEPSVEEAGPAAAGIETTATRADAEEAEAPAAAEPETDPLAAAERERDEYLELAQRAQADFENFRKRAAKEAAVAGERAKSGLVGELLPVVDNLERALDSAGEHANDLASGIGLVHSELIAVLARNGVEQFDPRGERFDPTFHEALSTRQDGEAGAGVVIEVVEKGYRLNGSVLRPARVVVSA